MFPKYHSPKSTPRSTDSFQITEYRGAGTAGWDETAFALPVPGTRCKRLGRARGACRRAQGKRRPSAFGYEHMTSSASAHRAIGGVIVAAQQRRMWRQRVTGAGSSIKLAMSLVKAEFKL